jgi:hypothetical protein
MSQKMYPFLFDAQINRREIVFRNVYQIFLFCAVKFCSFERELPQKMHLVFAKGVIECVLFYFWKQIQQRVNRRISENHGYLNLAKEEVMWFGLRAFIQTLNRKQTRFNELIKWMRHLIRELPPHRCELFHRIAKHPDILDPFNQMIF